MAQYANNNLMSKKQSLAKFLTSPHDPHAREAGKDA
jgi:hypothetical protein